MTSTTLVRHPLVGKVRRRAGRIKRAVLGRPEPVPAPRRRPAPTAAVPAPAAGAPVVPAGVADPAPDLTRLELRRRTVLSGQGDTPVILEIGPAHNPILPRRDGFRTKNVDYLDRAGLIEKYKAQKQYDPADIEEVDFVLAAGSAMATDIDERFDVVVASHVIEHTASLVHFLNECTELLADGGTLALVVPDHRFTFDRFRERSSLGRVVDAADNPPPVHTRGTIADFALNAARHRGTTSWAPRHRGDYSFVNTADRVHALVDAVDGTTYVDVHNWVFSPNHLRLLLHDLHLLGLITARETYFHPTVGHEFFLNLSVTGTGSGLSRQELVDLADAERRSLDVPTWAAPEAD